jgi:hypothetical protein
MFGDFGITQSPGRRRSSCFTMSLEDEASAIAAGYFCEKAKIAHAATARSIVAVNVSARTEGQPVCLIEAVIVPDVALIPLSP